LRYALAREDDNPPASDERAPAAHAGFLTLPCREAARQAPIPSPGMHITSGFA
jgi:hypothetical protein